MDIVTSKHPISSSAYLAECKTSLDRDGVLVLPNFLTDEAIVQVKAEGQQKISNAYFCVSKHNVYLKPTDANYPSDHPRNWEVTSSKGLIGDDQIDNNSPLKRLYHDPVFQAFVCHVVGEQELHLYADPMSSVNLHFAKTGQELGWHFYNSSFAITLLIDKPESGGVFEYLKDLRDADQGDMNFDAVGDLLSGKTQPKTLQMEPGTLVLFRGKNSIHRVTPTQGNRTRMLAVLAYNSKPGVSLSESARMTFYGRLN
jgi:hypothetical protein